ncbi:glycerophosphodiester phosphodiesterase family protein [Streptomyces sp. DSM 44917]|uniref:Glycerophosphodiester phosphodiesterase family protein n=1 Tax=Streptomyces boetiae TaxID=3075541 RepID=A0ABU2L573_9ACTN|nr:glycerophosphodiester phosphodiesterase family protein [Streptomyces sp. DSM 44917]MDT0306706.1 glycerophosphodiester phosphodiesterase family protein [Streptomyces sp. DSM 44917]
MPFSSPAEWARWLLGLTLVALGLAPAAGPGGVAEAAAAPGEEPLIVAHRGASGYAPENTLAAADAAAGLGAVWVETDVQRTADGELVLVHDTTLDRTTDVEELFPDRAPWDVADFAAAEIARLDAGSWFGEEFAGEGVPTLAEFAGRLAANGQRLLLEIKSPELYPGIEEDILEVLGEEGWLAERHPGERLVVQSFDADSVRTVHELAPRVETGFIGTPAVADVPAYAAFADQINPRHRDLTADYVEALQAVDGPHGDPVEVHAWTINDEATAQRVAGLGVDGIITNVPDVVALALAELRED